MLSYSIKKYVKASFTSERCFCCLDEMDYCSDPWEEIELTDINPSWIYYKLPLTRKYLVDCCNPETVKVCFSCAM